MFRVLVSRKSTSLTPHPSLLAGTPQTKLQTATASPTTGIPPQLILVPLMGKFRAFQSLCISRLYKLTYLLVYCSLPKVHRASSSRQSADFPPRVNKHLASTTCSKMVPPTPANLWCRSAVSLSTQPCRPRQSQAELRVRSTTTLSRFLTSLPRLLRRVWCLTSTASRRLMCFETMWPFSSS